MSRILKAFCKNRTPGPLGPLTPVGSSHYWVLLQVVSEDIVNSLYFVSCIFCLERKNYFSLELAKSLFTSIKFYVILLSFLSIQS